MGMISTNGWDTVFALRIPAINRAIAAAAGKGEIKIAPIDYKSDGLEMTGKFGIWQLTSEGLQNTGGTTVNMIFPVSGATLSWDGQRYEVADGIALGQVQLAKLADGTKHRLVIDRTKGVRIIDFRGGDPEAAEYFKIALEAVLQERTDIFKHDLAVVDFNAKAAKEISWLTPKAVGYWYSGGKNDDESCLAVLCMTENYVAGNPTPAPTLSNGLIPSGANCALLLSRQLFARNLLMPGVTEGLGLRCDAATEKKLKPRPKDLRQARIDRWFELQGRDAKIVKKPGSIAIASRRVDVSWLYGAVATGGGLGFANPWLLIYSSGLAGVTFVMNLITQKGKPAIMGDLALRIDKLEISSHEGEVSFKVALHGTLTVPTLFKLRIPLATVDVEVTTSHAPELSPDGKFHFRQKGKPVQSTPVVKLDKWLKNAAEVEKYVLLALTFIMDVVVGGAATALFAFEAALCAAGLQMLEKGVAFSTEDAAKSGMPVTFASFVDTAINPIQWNGKAGMTPGSVAIGEAMLIGGNLGSV